LNRIFRLLSCLLIVAIIVAGGCGSKRPPMYPAGGTVTYPDGKPFGAGHVEFRHVDPNVRVLTQGQIQPDGSFKLSTYKADDGAVEGDYQVLVAPMMPSTDAEARSLSSLIDPRFTQFDTSGWKFTVTRDPAKNQFALQVSRPPR
jgi:hypothetical protein